MLYNLYAALHSQARRQYILKKVFKFWDPKLQEIMTHIGLCKIRN